MDGAWANDTIETALTFDALRVRASGEEHGVVLLTTPTFAADETFVSSFTALAAKLCGSGGTYRGLYEGGAAFMTFGTITLGR